MKTYKELKIWQKSIDVVTEIYQLTLNFPKEEQFGLTNQMRRCSVSVPSNIAEGFGRNTDNEFKRFLSFSTGSLYELQTQLEICKRLKFISIDKFDKINNLTIEIDKMIRSFIKSLKT